MKNDKKQMIKRREDLKGLTLTYKHKDSFTERTFLFENEEHNINEFINDVKDSEKLKEKEEDKVIKVNFKKKVKYNKEETKTIDCKSTEVYVPKYEVQEK